MTVKYERQDEPEFDFKKKKNSQTIKFWQYFVAYLLYFGPIMAISYIRGSMIVVELGNGLAMLVLGLLYWISGGGLILAIEKVTGSSGEDADFIPGKNTALHMVLLSVTQIFFRCVFWTVEDFARMTYPDSHNTGIPYWRLMWFIQQTFEIIGTCVVFGTIALVSRVETEVENGSESMSLQNNEEF